MNLALFFESASHLASVCCKCTSIHNSHLREFIPYRCRHRNYCKTGRLCSIFSSNSCWDDQHLTSLDTIQLSAHTHTLGRKKSLKAYMHRLTSLLCQRILELFTDIVCKSTDLFEQEQCAHSPNL